MGNSDELHYAVPMIDFLELMWGQGYLSPGGAAEVARLLDGIDLSGKKVLDIGCGSGGITAGLVQDFAAAHVTGVDVEQPVCDYARNAVKIAGVAEKIDIQQITPGFPMPFESGTFDIVFSKDSIVHIQDKEDLAKEVMRLLAPGGWFVASDWLISHDNEPSAEMNDYIRSEDLGFGMASPTRYLNALKEAGFTNIELTNRNPWYTPVAELELQRMLGDERDAFNATMSKEDIDHQIQTWTMMLTVLRTGEHCPHHFRAQKP
ncbi:MAG: methyltransferase domain-containing protein [Pseudomonadales bacterium]